MKLVRLLEEPTVKARLLEIQQLIVERYRDDVIETDLRMIADGDHSWATKHPALKVKVTLDYWSAEAINVMYKPQHSALGPAKEPLYGLYSDGKGGPDILKRGAGGWESVFSKVDMFFAAFIATMTDGENYYFHSSFQDAFKKKHDIKQWPLNFSVASLQTLFEDELTVGVEVEHLTMDELDKLHANPRLKTHQAKWKASTSNDCYIIWVPK